MNHQIRPDVAFVTAVVAEALGQYIREMAANLVSDRMLAAEDDGEIDPFEQDAAAQEILDALATFLCHHRSIHQMGRHYVLAALSPRRARALAVPPTSDQPSE